MALMKFGICNEIFKEWSFEKAFEFVKQTGYDGIEIAPFTCAQYVTDVSQQRRSEIKDLAAKYQLEISGIHWVLVEAEGMHMTHPDTSIRSKTQQYFRDLVQFCDDLGGKSIIVGSPHQRNLEPGVSLEQATEWATEVFRPAVKDGEDKGVTICFEPLAPSETNFMNTAAEAIEFIHRIPSPAFKIILDVKAMCSMGKSIPDIIHESWPEFAYFHANDENLKGPGFGDVDFVPIGSALKEVCYEGYVSVEVFKFEEGPEAIAQRSLEYLRKSFS
ncbi:MAG: sugar phosphate isomerase/epimerase [Verrucomicrobia bacterium]|nr:sugar phosphate isomerase/epimerase [Verrucomicrobiota bacterium]